MLPTSAVDKGAIIYCRDTYFVYHNYVFSLYEAHKQKYYLQEIVYIDIL